MQLSKPQSSSRRFSTFVTLAACLLAAAPGARGAIQSERLLAAIITRTPAPRLVAEGRQMQQAEAAAARLPGARAFYGVGQSMEPLYAPRTAIVVVAADFEKLQKGVTVVYLNSRGVRVAHAIVGETRGGYLVRGVNNATEDPELVTPDNYLGTVTQAYASTDTAFRTDTEHRLAAKNLLRVSSRS